MVTTIRLPDDLHKKIKSEAEKKGLTFNGYLLGVLWQQKGSKTMRENKPKIATAEDIKHIRNLIQTYKAKYENEADDQYVSKSDLRCYAIGYLVSNPDMAYTSRQIKEIFDVLF